MNKFTPVTAIWLYIFWIHWSAATSRVVLDLSLGLFLTMLLIFAIVLTMLSITSDSRSK